MYCSTKPILKYKRRKKVVYKFIYRRFDQNWKNVYYELFSYQTGNVHEIGKVFFDNISRVLDL